MGPRPKCSVPGCNKMAKRRDSKSWKKMCSNHNSEKYLKFPRASRWNDFFSEDLQCEMCGERVYFNRKDRDKSVHFDHRHGGNELIFGSPFDWLSSHARNQENESIWRSCDFGILCFKCNLRLPTTNRVTFAKNLVKYVLGIAI